MTAAELSAVEPRPAADLDPEVDELIASARSWVERRLVLRDRIPGFVLGGTFAVLALTLLALFPAIRSVQPATYVLFIAVYAAVSRVEFEVGPCLALPTQLVLVPMLFVLPLRTVPVCVAGALLLGDAAAARGRVVLERVPLRLANAWHAIGPVLVLGA